LAFNSWILAAVRSDAKRCQAKRQPFLISDSNSLIFTIVLEASAFMRALGRHGAARTVKPSPFAEVGGKNRAPLSLTLDTCKNIGGRFK